MLKREKTRKYLENLNCCPQSLLSFNFNVFFYILKRFCQEPFVVMLENTYQQKLYVNYLIKAIHFLYTLGMFNLEYSKRVKNLYVSCRNMNQVKFFATDFEIEVVGLMTKKYFYQCTNEYSNIFPPNIDIHIRFMAILKAKY